MLYISHRGNLDGINREQENKPLYILNTLEKNFDVEVDAWFVKDTFYLGHDKPEHMVNKEFIKTKGLWFHAKNVEAFHELLKLNVNFILNLININLIFFIRVSSTWIKSFLTVIFFS